MQSLSNLYKRIFKSGTWKYYDEMCPCYPFTGNVSENCRSFISKYLLASDKNSGIIEYFDKLEDDRCSHIVSTFFLGLLFYYSISEIKMAIDKTIDKYTLNIPDNITVNFPYFWFQICFFHDVGYYFETTDNTNSLKDIDILKNSEKIENNLGRLIGVPKLYNGIWKNYLKYKLSKFNNLDHGIIGGLLVYDRLVKIYNKFRQFNNCDDFYYNGLYWSKEFTNFFKVIGWTILCHNIWFLNKDYNDSIICDKYKKYNLDKLIIDNESRVLSLKKYPFLSLLCFVDTIEPIKKFNPSILDNIKIICSFQKNTLFISSSKEDKKIFDWLQSLHEISQWMNIDCQYNARKSHLEIIF